MPTDFYAGLCSHTIPQYTFLLRDLPPSFDSGVVKAIPGCWPLRAHPNIVKCADHAAAILADFLGASGVRFEVEKPAAKRVTVNSLPVPPLMRPEAVTLLNVYQRSAIQASRTRPGVFFHHSTGAGKSLSGLYAGMLSPPPLLYITRASARVHIAAETRKYTTANSLILHGGAPPWGPTGEEEVKVSGTTEYLVVVDGTTRWKTVPAMVKAGLATLVVDVKAGKMLVRDLLGATQVRGQGHWLVRLGPLRPVDLPEVVIVSWEGLHHYADLVVKEVKPIASVFDESHFAKNPKRVTGVEEADGTVSWLKNNNRAAAIERISKTVKRRILTSATPVRNRLSDLWSQLDLMEPFQWGTYRSFTQRYCGGFLNKWGGWDATGRTNEEELARRFTFVRHLVDRKETHAHLPPLRREVVRVEMRDQDDPTQDAEFEAMRAEVVRSGRARRHACLPLRR